jgi:hypothetical protein
VRGLLLVLLLAACSRSGGKGAKADRAPAPEATPAAPAAPPAPITRCPGALTRFGWKFQAGAVAQGQREEASISGEMRDGALTLRYEWTGDVEAEAPVGKGDRITQAKLTYTAPATDAERAAWEERLALPILQRPRPTPGPTPPVRDESLMIEREGCWEFGTPAPAWQEAAAALRVRAGEDVPYARRAAHRLPVDDVVARLDAGDWRGALQCGETHIEAEVSPGRLVFRAVPEGDCTLTVDGVSEPYAGVRRGDRLACAPTPRRADCRVVVPGDRPPAG